MPRDIGSNVSIARVLICLAVGLSASTAEASPAALSKPVSPHSALLVRLHHGVPAMLKRTLQPVRDAWVELAGKGAAVGCSGLCRLPTSRNSDSPAKKDPPAQA